MPPNTWIACAQIVKPAGHSEAHVTGEQRKVGAGTHSIKFVRGMSKFDSSSMVGRAKAVPMNTRADKHREAADSTHH